jgi:hypothetical protein
MVRARTKPDWFRLGIHRPEPARFARTSVDVDKLLQLSRFLVLTHLGPGDAAIMDSDPIAR